ncbi:PREDICTED: uncharacterized protein LOC104805245 [Tarenaya hassleriana]|uniref:uncharacterized protein LOC104805245 n=1 Tax=Tarenaya hassleriana TaxID=28532 RepID=UPI00053C92ED|nr:PREDICTED: uncharacterized protein LOC104805245 [Tarenaya hassleriana]
MNRLRILSSLLRKTHRSSCSFSVSRRPITNAFYSSLSGKPKFSYHNGSGGYSWNLHHPQLWIIFSGQAAILGLSTNPVLADDLPIEPNSRGETNEASMTGLEKVEDGSVVSNIHTSKWRVFTDNGRDYFLQGKLDQAEKFFCSAIQEAKEGFGERDPHVASACNNLAELYRVKKDFDKAEPLYLEALSILEQSYGPEDVRVGATLHNLGQFYLVQRKLAEARSCYERALKIKRRVLGQSNPDYADTMYHLGTVLHLQGKETDAEALILDSLKILEEDGLEESLTYIRRSRYLSQIYLKSNHLAEAENIQRKLLHTLELSKGWKSMETVNAAEALALTLQSTGQLRDALDLFERCLDSRKTLLPETHIQIGGNLLHIARTLTLRASRSRKADITEALSELDKAKKCLEQSIRIAKDFLHKLKKQKGKEQKLGKSKDENAALVILLQSFESLALLEMNKNQIQETKEEHPEAAEDALFQCISTFKEFGTGTHAGDSPEVKSAYLSCLKHLQALLADKSSQDSTNSKAQSDVSLQDLRNEIRRIEKELVALQRR